MRLRKAALDTFVSTVREYGWKIVVYGAGVIGKNVMPTFMEEWHLADRVLFVVDADPHKLGGCVRVGERDIEICQPQRIKGVKEKFVVLITGSRYENILRNLEQMEGLQETDVYIFPQMLAERCRFFKKQEIEKKTERSIIPKIIHYCWFGGGELPDGLKRCRDSWSRFCPDYKIVEWNEDNYDIGRYEYTRQAYCHRKWGFIPDIARLDILYENGGIYLDTDVELMRTLDELLYQPGFVGVEKWGIINIGGGCGVMPKHPAIQKILQYRLEFPFERRDGSLNLESSGGYESKPLIDWGFKPNNTIQSVGGMTIYSSDFFHPFDYMSRELCITENTYGIHHFAGSWLSGDEVGSKKLEF